VTYVDKLTEMSDEQAVTASAASTDYIDLEDAGRDVGVGEETYLVIIVDESVTAAGAATVVFALETDDNSGFSSATALVATAAIPKATLVAGYEVLVVALPHNCERYLRVYYTVATGPLTAGKFTAMVVKDPEAWKSYPDAL
jgi:hypothetical protein